MEKNFIVGGWRILEDGAVSEVTQVEQLDQEGVWVHCDRSSSQFEQWLVDHGFSTSIIESLLASDTRPRFQQISEDSFFLILRGVNLNKGKEPDDMLTIRLLYTPQRVISCNAQHSKAIHAVLDSFRKGNNPACLELVVTEILSEINKKIETVVDPIEAFIESQDNDNFKKEAIDEIALQQKKLLRLNRFLKPQVHALAGLCKDSIPPFQEHQIVLNNQLDNLNRLVDTIDFFIAQIEVLNNRIAQYQSELMNRNTYLLSLIAGVFLPLGFLTGLFGVNIGGMPGVENTAAFYLFCAVLAGIGIWEVMLLKKMKFM